MKTIVERGASWGLDETKLLLSLWGQDLVGRQTTNLKRTKEVYERISEKLNQNSYERTAEQVRTRIFNMIAEYRRILRDDQNSERRQKCVFFEPLHKIYQAKHMEDVRSALDDYEPEGSYSPLSSMTLEEGSDETAIHDASTAVSGGDLDMTGATSNNNITTNSKQQDTVNQQNNAQSAATNNSSTSTTTATTLQPTHLLTNVNDPNDSLNNTTNNNNVKKTYSNLPNNQQTTNNITSTPQTNNTTSITNNNQQQAKSLLISQNQQSSVGGPQQATFISTLPAGTQSATTSQQRHQSILLPHTAASTSQNNNPASSTPLTKLTNATATNGTPSYITINSGKTPTLYRTNQLINHPGIQVAGSSSQDNNNGIGQAAGGSRLTPATATIASHQLYQAPVNTFDVTSSALLIDRVFAHLSRESENMREWISLEKERLALERARRQHEADREARRERILVETLVRFQKEWIENINRILPNAGTSNTEATPIVDGPSAGTLTSSQNTIEVAASPPTQQQNADSIDSEANSDSHMDTSKRESE